MLDRLLLHLQNLLLLVQMLAQMLLVLMLLP